MTTASAAPARRVVVIGAGIAGLTVARRLLAAGAEVTVLERAARPGGVLTTTTADGFTREHAANGFLTGADDGAAALADELGVALEEASKAARARWIWINGARHALPSGPLSLLRTDLLTWRGKLALLAEPLHPRRTGDESVHGFAARRLGPELARAVVAPFVTGVFAGDAHDISLEAGFPRLAALDDRGGLLRGALAMAADRVRHPRRRRRSRLAAPVGGMQALTAAAARGLGDRLRLGAEVTAVQPVSGGVEVVVDGGAVHHDAAVLAVPAHVAAPLVAGAVPALAARLGEIRYAPTAIVHLGFEIGAIGDAAHGFGVLVAAGEAPRVLGVVFESTLWPSRAPAGKALLRCIFGGTRDPDVLDLDDAGLIAAARADLATVLDLTATPVHAEVTRWPRAIAQYTLGHRDRVAAAESLAHPRRLALAGSAYHGVAVNDCIADAARVTELVGKWLA